MNPHIFSHIINKKVFVNPYGKRDGLDDDLSAMLDYMCGNMSDNAFVWEIDHQVQLAREHKEWQAEYMVWRVVEMDAGREGREEKRIGMINRMLRGGKAPEQIADFCGFSIDEVMKVQETILQYAVSKE